MLASIICGERNVEAVREARVDLRTNRLLETVLPPSSRLVINQMELKKRILRIKQIWPSYVPISMTYLNLTDEFG